MTAFEITAPLKGFTGVVVGIDFKAGKASVDTDNDAGRAAYAYFERAGYGIATPTVDDQDGPQTPPAKDDDPFDPSEHKVDEVLTYLDTAPYEDAARVLDAEADGQNRVTITGKREQILADKTPAAPAGDDSKGRSA